MGKCVKEERYAWIHADGKKRWLDISTYDNGTRYFNLRGLVPESAIWVKSCGKKLTWVGAPVAQWVINQNGKIRAPLANLANAQEKKDGKGSMQDKWKGWFNRWEQYNDHFLFEGVLDK